MLDTRWFIDAMMGDKIIVRMHTTWSSNNVRTTVIEAYSYWNDDMAYNGFVIRYEYEGLHEPGRLLPLEYTALPSDPNEWHSWLESHAQDWSEYWERAKDVVCTLGESQQKCRKVPAAHPGVLVHLARFQGAVRTYQAPGTWGTTTGPGIVYRRLDGLLKRLVREWEALVGG